MKILHTVESYLPEVNGMQEVVQQLSERLVETGYDVTIATSFHPGRHSNTIHGVKIKPFKISGNTTRGIKGETKAYLDFVVGSSFDIVTNFAAQQWATDLLLPNLKAVKAKKIFVPTGFSMLSAPGYQDYFTSLVSQIRDYDWTIFLGKDLPDYRFAKNLVGKRFSIIPNGGDEREFSGRQIEKNGSLILHVGNHNGNKGHAELIQIFNQANLPNTKLLIIGRTNYQDGCWQNCRKLTAASSGRIVLKNCSRAKTVAAFKKADLFLFPSQIECSPIVLYESIAGKTPFLVTDVGNAKEIIRLTKGGKLLPTLEVAPGYKKAEITKSANLLKSVWQDKSLLKKLGDAGYSAWRKNFTWEKIASSYEKLYLSLLKEY